MNRKTVPTLMLDATELTRDWMLSGLEFQLVGFLTDLQRIEAAVPESVIVEVVGNHSREMDSATQAMRKLGRLLSRLGVSTDLEKFSADLQYETYLRGRLEALGVQTLPWPTVTHEEVARRAVDRRPPFDSSGSGYRDSLVWASVLDATTAGKEVVLASQDKIFSNGSGDLSTTLQSEVLDSSGSVQLIRQLGKWLAQVQPWGDVNLPEAAGRARDALFLNYFAPWDMFEDPDFGVEDLGLPPETYIHEIEYVASGELETTETRKTGFSSTQIVYTFFADFRVTFDIYEEFAVEYSLDWELSSTIGQVEVSVVIRMDAVMTVDFDPRRDSGGEWPYEIVDIAWLPRHILDFANPPYDPGPDQLAFDFSGQQQ